MVKLSVSPGEAIDRLIVLEIKARRIQDREKLDNVRRELARVSEIVEPLRSSLDRAHIEELRHVNEDLWDIQEKLRHTITSAGPLLTLGELAVQEVALNDRRALLRRSLSESVGSDVVDEKSYDLGPGPLAPVAAVHSIAVPEKLSSAIIYQTNAQMWMRAERVRGRLIYNFLLASAILLVAWATVFASSGISVYRSWFLCLFCVAGGFLSTMWIVLGFRSREFAGRYIKLALELEAPAKGPFAVAHQHRLSLRGISRLARLDAVIAVPLLFALVYLALGVLSLIAA